MHLIFDGRLTEASALRVPADSLGCRFGDGLFETMLVSEGKIRLWEDHLQRLYRGMEALGYAPDPDLGARVLDGLRLLGAEQAGRPYMRATLEVFAADRDLFRTEPLSFHFLFRAEPVDPASCDFQPAGVRAGVFTGMCRCPGPLSEFKTRSYLSSALAARYAASQGWGDALLLNSHGRVAESAIANVFVFREGELLTPPLTEGCVGGVMRKHLLRLLPAAGFPVREQALEIQDLETAAEIFLTNAFRTLRPVTRFGDRTYPVDCAREIFRLVQA